MNYDRHRRCRYENEVSRLSIAPDGLRGGGTVVDERHLHIVVCHGVICERIASMVQLVVLVLRFRFRCGGTGDTATTTTTTTTTTTRTRDLIRLSTRDTTSRSRSRLSASQRLRIRPVGSGLSRQLLLLVVYMSVC